MGSNPISSSDRSDLGGGASPLLSLNGRFLVNSGRTHNPSTPWSYRGEHDG
jgi:hypothetical protein